MRFGLMEDFRNPIQWHRLTCNRGDLRCRYVGLTTVVVRSMASKRNERLLSDNKNVYVA